MRALVGEIPPLLTSVAHIGVTEIFECGRRRRTHGNARARHPTADERRRRCRSRRKRARCCLPRGASPALPPCSGTRPFLRGEKTTGGDGGQTPSVQRFYALTVANDILLPFLQAGGGPIKLPALRVQIGAHLGRRREKWADRNRRKKGAAAAAEDPSERSRKVPTREGEDHIASPVRIFSGFSGGNAQIGRNNLPPRENETPTPLPADDDGHGGGDGDDDYAIKGARAAPPPLLPLFSRLSRRLLARG